MTGSGATSSDTVVIPTYPAFNPVEVTGASPLEEVVLTDPVWNDDAYVVAADDDYDADDDVDEDE